ncbi:LppM family (lipo)protein [Demequina oxidasica]|uniref:LppM family (lipo)protein n=1 Tax=Demequina oxidasica TaxID=676199 RepID=UPI000786022D
MPLRLALVAVIGAATLSGCMRFTADLRLEPDNTVDGTYVVAVENGTGNALGISDAEAAQNMYDDSGLASQLAHSMQRVYRDDGFTGVQVEFRGENLARFAPTDDRFGVIREGDEFVVSGPSSEVSEDDAESLKGADLRVSIEFPGPVTESNGTVEGNTVTWNLVGGPDVLTARGSAVRSSSPLGAILMTVLVLGSAGAVLRSRFLATNGPHRKQPARPRPTSASPQRPPSTPGKQRRPAAASAPHQPRPAPPRK